MSGSGDYKDGVARILYLMIALSVFIAVAVLTLVTSSLSAPAYLAAVVSAVLGGGLSAAIWVIGERARHSSQSGGIYWHRIIAIVVLASAILFAAVVML